MMLLALLLYALLLYAFAATALATCVHVVPAATTLLPAELKLLLR
jgi:hypothetical protein